MPFTPGRPIPEAKADLFRAMAHPARVRILELLSDQDLSVGELASETGLELSHLSQQLAVLRRAGLVERRREKSRVICALSDPKIVRLLAVARELLVTHLNTTQELLQALNDADDAISAVLEHPRD